MQILSFEKYWINFGKFHHEILKNNNVSEEDFYNLSRKIWQDALQTEKMSYDKGYSDGWAECEQKSNIQLP